MKRFIIALLLLVNLSAFAGTVSVTFTDRASKQEDNLTFLGTGKVIFIKNSTLGRSHYIELKDKSILIFKDVRIFGNRNHLFERVVDVYRSNQGNIYLRENIQNPEVAK